MSQSYRKKSNKLGAKGGSRALKPKILSLDQSVQGSDLSETVIERVYWPLKGIHCLVLNLWLNDE